jgi:hypothetical protein
METFKLIKEKEQNVKMAMKKDTCQVSRSPVLQGQQIHKEIVMEKTLAQAKENIWIDIKSMLEIWPSIQIIFKQHELVQKDRESIENIK